MSIRGRFVSLAVIFLLIGNVRGEGNSAGPDFLQRLRDARTAASAKPSDPAVKPPGNSGRSSQSTRRMEAVKANVLRNILLFKGEDSRGTGFLCRLWGVPVIVTNAHVFTRMLRPEIRDSQGRIFTFRAALVSRKRDLALLEAEPPPDSAPLTLQRNVGTLTIHSRLYAYGNSHGDQVIATLPGTLLSIGPDEIEISAPIVSGNSGGPVVDPDGEVIGVASHLITRTFRETILESRYFGNVVRQRQEVRRFALRIDNLDPEEFEFFDPQAQLRDLEIYRKLADGSETFFRDLPQYRNFQLWLFCYRQFRRLAPDWQHRASLAFLDQLLRREQERGTLIAAYLDIPPILLNAEENRQAAFAFQRMQKYRRDKFHCDQCRDPRYTARNRLSPVKESSSGYCHNCYGLGRIDSPYYQFRTTPFPVRQPTFRLGGVAPGMDMALVLRLLKAPPGKQPVNLNGFLQLYRLKSNPNYPESTETRLTFVAKRLSGVSVCFSRAPGLWQELCDDLTQKLGKPALSFGDGDDWGYRLYRTQGATTILSAISDDSKSEIRLESYHNILTDLEFRIIQSLGGNLFVPPGLPLDALTGFFPFITERPSESQY